MKGELAAEFQSNAQTVDIERPELSAERAGGVLSAGTSAEKDRTERFDMFVPGGKDALNDDPKQAADEKAAKENIFNSNDKTMPALMRAAQAGFVNGLTVPDFGGAFSRASIQKEKEERSSRDVLMRLALNSSAELNKKLQERLGELRDLSERYGRNIDARNLVLEMIRRGEDPFAKDKQGNYIHHDLLFNKDQADFSRREVEGMEGLSQSGQKAAVKQGVEIKQDEKKEADKRIESIELIEEQRQAGLIDQETAVTLEAEELKKSVPVEKEIDISGLEDPLSAAFEPQVGTMDYQPIKP